MRKMRKSLWLIMMSVLLAALAACASGQSSGGSSGGSAASSGGSSSGSSSGASASGGGGSASSQQPVQLRVMWWGDQNRADITNAMLKKFEEKYPNIKIVPEFSPFSGYFDKLNTELASGTAPDVFTLGGNILEYATKGVLLNLNPYVGKELDTSDMSPTLNNYNTFGGKLQGISVGANSQAVLINTALLKKAGIDLPTKDWTWDDYAKISNEVTQKLGKGYYGSYDYSGQADQFGIWLQQNGKEVYDQKNQKLGFTSQDLQTWFTMWSQMRKDKGIVTPEVEVSNDPTDATKSLVPKGQVAIQFLYTNQLGDFQKNAKDPLALVPVPKGPQGNMISVMSSQNIVGYAKTKHPKEVAELMNFWINDADAAKILGNDRGVPVSAKMRAVLKANATDTDKAIYNYLDEVATDNVPVAYNIPGSNEFNQELLKASQNVSFGRTSIKQAADDFYAQAQKILQSNLSKSSN